eukprot:gnl/TRDRNA2_/TRDRNA2_162598_c0_seq1.p1 gnl/TRDRNA2_/TRDRNA2_162598_c0~~gnl/TRDRNA2_/TRDRNA2_162598_c0_seq1.p1  ORF type:complete len:405 (-),score=64.23 gnl/TRDRNA2_/TRDRNA2_162598_c0_seq1:133-1293(-)
MSSPSLALHKPLLEEAPRNIRSSHKLFTLLSLIIGLSVAVLSLGVAVLAISAPWIDSGVVEQLFAQKPTMNQAAVGHRTFWQSRLPPFRQPSLQRSPVRASALTEASRDLDTLLKSKQSELVALNGVIAGQGEEYDDVWLVRFILGNPDDLKAAKKAAEAALKWRKGVGKPIVEAAKEAFADATKDGGWDNNAAFSRAPHAEAIRPFIGPEGSHIFTVPTEWGDLCSVIRAPAIDDDNLMKAVTVQQLTDFFVYVKELNALVCNSRTRSTGQLCQIISANDLNGVLRLPNSDFGKALSESSKTSLALYPLLAGPTLLLNLPIVLQVVVDNLFKPLFPERVAAKIRFERGPLLDLTDLKGLREPAERTKFLGQIGSLQPSLKALRLS